jgi:voltage-gated potassium channel Kch
MKSSVLIQSRLTTAGKLLLGVGSSIIILALIYMLANIDRADAIIHVWFITILTGICLTLISCLFVNRNTQKKANNT